MSTALDKLSILDDLFTIEDLAEALDLLAIRPNTDPYVIQAASDASEALDRFVAELRGRS